MAEGGESDERVSEKIASRDLSDGWLNRVIKQMNVHFSSSPSCCVSVATLLLFVTHFPILGNNKSRPNPVRPDGAGDRKDPWTRCRCQGSEGEKGRGCEACAVCAVCEPVQSQS
jgi:hypothetical protein